MPTIADIRHTLANHPPRLVSEPDKRHAAVAVILQGNRTELRLLFIERTEREGDPWSGHIAFPGGRVEACDRETRHTAERETREEIDLDLRPAEYLGRLDDLTGNTLPVLVSGFVYSIENAGPFQLSSEVKDAFWVPVTDLIDAKRHVEYCFHHRGAKSLFPAIDLLGAGRPVLWGLTYRFVAQLLHLLDLEIPQTARPLQP